MKKLFFIVAVVLLTGCHGEFTLGGPASTGTGTDTTGGNNGGEDTVYQCPEDPFLAMGGWWTVNSVTYGMYKLGFYASGYLLNIDLAMMIGTYVFTPSTDTELATLTVTDLSNSQFVYQIYNVDPSGSPIYLKLNGINDSILITIPQ